MATVDNKQVGETDTFMSSDESFRRNLRGGGVPVDRGWAWFVLAGAMLIMLIAIGGIRASGVMFLAYQTRFGTSSATTSLISTARLGTLCLTGTLVMTVGLRMYSCRTVVFIGSVVMFISFITTAFSTDFQHVIGFQGVVAGVAYSCLEGPVMSLVTKYFDRRRGLANSLTTAGGSLGGLIFPPLVTLLLDKYGYWGSMILLAAVNLHIAIGAALFRPLSFYHQYERRTVESESLKLTKRSFSLPVLSILKEIVDSFDFKLFLNPLFVLFQLAFGLASTASYLNVLFMPPLGNDMRLSDEQSAALVTIYSAIDMCARVIVGVLADLQICNRSTILSICALGLGVTSHCVRFYSSFGFLSVHIVISGLTGGAAVSLYAGIIVDVLTLPKLDATIAFAMLSMALNQAGFSYLGGLLKDETGTYVATYHLIGTLSLTGGAIMFALPFVERWKKSRQTDRNRGEVVILSKLNKPSENEM